jgi:zinc transport system permease protein
MTHRTTTHRREATMHEVLLLALAAALLLAAMLGPLGVFVVWRRLSYFGDTIAHASLLGIALAFLSGGLVPMPLAIFAVAASVAVLLSWLTRDRRFQADTILGLLAHSALALGVVLIALERDVRTDLHGFLFGDVLTTTTMDLAVLSGLLILCLGLMRWLWRPMLMLTLHPGIAAVEGVPVVRIERIFTLLLAAVIAFAIPRTGVLLITAFLIMPAMAARYLARTPVQMAWLASLLGMVAATGGLAVAWKIDAPAGPMMVVTAAAIVALAATATMLRGGRPER